MATGDFQDLQGLVAAAAQRDTSLSADVTAVKSAINEVLLSIYDEAEGWDFLRVQGTQAMVVGQEAYTYATIGTSLGGVTISHIVAVGGLTHVDWDDYWEIKNLNLSLPNGTPTIWTETADATLYVWPKPAATTALTILALKVGAELSANGDLPLIPARMSRRVIVPGAAAILLRQEGGAESDAEAARYDALYEQARSELRQGHALGLPSPATESPTFVLPAGLLGASGSYLDLALKALYQAGLPSWRSYNLARAKEVVNECYRSIVDTGDPWDTLQTDGQIVVNAGEDTLSISAMGTAMFSGPLRDVLEITVDNTGDGSGPLKAMSWRALESLAQSTVDSDSQGRPELWAKWGDRIRLYPAPDKDYTLGVYCIRGAAALSADSDVPLLPAGWAARVIVPCAASKLAEQRGTPEGLRQSQSLWSEYLKNLADMRAAHAASRPPVLGLVSPSFAPDQALGPDGGWW